jgi:hypothetical protein
LISNIVSPPDFFWPLEAEVRAMPHRHAAFAFMALLSLPCPDIQPEMETS